MGLEVFISDGIVGYQSREALLSLLAKCEDSLLSPSPEPTQARMAIETFIAGLECAWNYLQQLRVNKSK